MTPPTVRATCYQCRRVFDLPPEVATPDRRCQICGGQFQYSAATGDAGPATADRRDPVMGGCSVCDTQNRFDVGQRLVKCSRCGTEIMEPERPGALSRVAQAPVTGKLPDIAVACPHCGGRARMPVEAPNPNVRCETCQKAITPAYLPLEKWADVRALAPPASLAELLLVILRARWNAGAVAPGEVLRHVGDLRTVTTWLMQRPEERKSDFPLGVTATAEVLKCFILRVDKADVQSQSADRVILTVPTKREEPRERDTRFMRKADLEKPERVNPSLIISVGAVPAGSVFGFLAQDASGVTGALAADRLAEVQQMIAAAIPRATFRYLAHRYIFGEMLKPSTMMFVPPSVVERELKKLGLPPERIKMLVEKMTS